MKTKKQARKYKYFTKNTNTKKKIRVGEHEFQRKNKSYTFIWRMIPLVRSPFSKHKYDYVRNEMRMRVG
jgi:membrane protein DedA with SNARE-associated domain